MAPIRRNKYPDELEVDPEILTGRIWEYCKIKGNAHFKIVQNFAACPPIRCHKDPDELGVDPQIPTGIGVGDIAKI